MKYRIEKTDGNFELYESGEYIPISVEAPSRYEFAVIRKSGSILTETYYLKSGDRSIVTYSNGKWESTETTFLSAKAFSVLPMIGFGLVIFAIIRRSIRTGAITTWELSKYPFEGIEKLVMLYGVPFFLSGIIFGFLGRV